MSFWHSIRNINISLTHKYLIHRIVVCFYSTLNVLTRHVLYMHYVAFKKTGRPHNLIISDRMISDQKEPE